MTGADSKRVNVFYQSNRAIQRAVIGNPVTEENNNAKNVATSNARHETKSLLYHAEETKATFVCLLR